MKKTVIMLTAIAVLSLTGWVAAGPMSSPMGPEIKNLGDVSINSLTDGQVLKYNSTSKKWENGLAGSGTGDVTGPRSSTDGNIVLWDGTDGDTIKDSAYSPSSFAGAIHASGHTTGQSDEIDGDKVDIDWNPSNYTPTTSPAEADSADNLTAHLAGIDAFLGTVGSGTGDVVGPSSATDSNFASFDTTTGKLIKDSGYAPSSFEAADPDITKADAAETITEQWEFSAGIATGRTAEPTLVFKDLNCTDEDDNAKVYANATDTGSGTEDVDVTIAQQVAGAMTDTLVLDADATNPLSIRGNTIPQTYTIQATITEPDQLAASDKLIVWKNTTGSTFTITAIYAISDVDDTDFVLDEYDADGASNTDEIDAVQCTTGSGPYTVDITSGISHTTIEDGHVIAFDADASDTPGYIFFAIKGHF